MIFNLINDCSFPGICLFLLFRAPKKCTLCVQECESPHNPGLFINIVTGIHNPVSKWEPCMSDGILCIESMRMELLW